MHDILVKFYSFVWHAQKWLTQRKCSLSFPEPFLLQNLLFSIDWSKNEFVHFLISSHTLPKQKVKVKGWQFSIVYCYLGLCQFEYAMKRNTIVHNLKQESGRKYNPRASFQHSQISFWISVFWHWQDTSLRSFGTMKHSIIDYNRCSPWKQG